MMVRQSTPTSGTTTHNAVVSLLLPCLLIGHFLWNVLTPAHEYPMRSDQMLTMALDFLGLLGLIGLKASIPKSLFWIALVAGIGLLALRLNGDAGWWTGHLVYSLLPR
jgi:hypothetical protein